MSYYHTAKEADMAAMAEPLCLERGKRRAAAFHGRLCSYVRRLAARAHRGSDTVHFNCLCVVVK